MPPPAISIGLPDRRHPDRGAGASSCAIRRTSSSRRPRSLYLLLTSAAREILRGVEHGHRRRGPRDRGHQARRPPGPQPRAPRAPRAAGRRAPRGAPADRAVGHAAAARDDRPVPRRGRRGPRRHDRRRRRAQAARPRGRRPGRGHGASSARSCRRTQQPGGPGDRPATCARASGRRSTRGSSS